MNPARIAIVGCGYWGIKLCRVLASIENAEVAWIIDSNQIALKQASTLLRGAKPSHSVTPALEDESVNAVVIATPLSRHFTMAVDALRAGKHVFVEKPLAATLAEGVRLRDEAERRGLALMVGHTFLYSDPVRRIKTIIDSGELGDLRYIFSRRLSPGIVRHDTSVLWDLGAHDVSMLDYWIDQPLQSVQAIGFSYLRPNEPDLAFGHLRFQGGVSGHFQVAWLDPEKVRSATIVGDRKMLVYTDTSPSQPIAIYDSSVELVNTPGASASFAEHQTALRTGDIVLPYVPFQEPLMTEMTEFVNRVVDPSVELVSDANRGVRILRILEALQLSMNRGETVEFSQASPVPSVA